MKEQELGRRRLISLLSGYLRRYWAQTSLLVFINLVVALLMMASTAIMAPILNVALGKDQANVPPPSLSQLNLENLGPAVLHWMGSGGAADAFGILVFLAVVYVLIAVTIAILRYVNYLLALWLRTQSAADLQTNLFRHMLYLPMGFFTRHRTGDLVSRLDRDTARVTEGFEGIIGPAITSSLLVVFYGTLLFRTSPALTLAAVASISLHYLISLLLHRPILKRMQTQANVLGHVTAVTQEALLTIRVIKSFCAEAFEFKKYGSAVASVLRANLKFGFYKHAEEPLRGITDRIVDLGILLPAAYELLHGRLSAASFFLFLYVGRATVAPISALGQVVTQMSMTVAASARVFEVFDSKSDVADGPKQADALKDSIRIENVNFSYDQTPILQDVTLSIKRGETIAIVGPSGAGKSTLFDIILRFYDPVGGRIVYDGEDIRDFVQSSYRRHFGVVAQESLLFNTTVRANIAYGRDGLSGQDIIDAAVIANAHSFIMALPDGYETLVGDRGIRLSGGQRQRIAIARAIVARPDILLLDEATSALDTESERQVQDAIDRATEQTTSLIIAHRLSTVLHADRIVVLDKGRISAVGSHDELLASSSTYKNLYEHQFRTAAAVEATE